ncbi:MAG TPA: MlaD family protein [Steroidobacteraceae bacterium]|nr:MlaD family protein [Steroidobacteraceae bacterium]
MAETTAAEPRRTLAEMRKSRAPGWIWAVPIAALGIVIWLLLRSLSHRGIDVTVVFEDAAGMSANGTKVMYRGLNVGTVSSVALEDDGVHIRAHLDLNADMQKLLTTGTRFYLQGAQPSFSDPASLKSIVAGPTIVMIAGPGAPARHFRGTAGEPPETFAVKVPYLVRFQGAVGGMQVGSTVTLRGFTVGEVSSVTLSVDARTGQISTPVVVSLDPTRFHIRELTGSHDWVAVMNQTLDTLVQHGLRARLMQTPPLIGSPEVMLEVIPDAGMAQLTRGADYPEIPTAEGGGLQDLTRKLGQLPVKEIGDNVREITARLKALSSSPQLEDSIKQLDRTLRELQHTVHDAGPQIAPTIASIHGTVDSLRKTAGDIDATAAAAKSAMGGAAASPDGNVQQALHELTEAARAIRTLADYIDQHPESFLRGRQGS